MSNISAVKSQMQQTVASLEEDLRTLRPGRASEELITSLPVPAYGGNMPVRELGSISANDEGQLIVQVWDKSVLGAVEKAIRDSQLGFSVINEGASLRLSLPPLSQERRQELAKLVSQKAEAARVQLRQIRSDAHRQATNAKASGEMREDDLTRLTKELNDTIDQFNTQIKTIAERKEQELLQV